MNMQVLNRTDLGTDFRRSLPRWYRIPKSRRTLLCT